MLMPRLRSWRLIMRLAAPAAWASLLLIILIDAVYLPLAPTILAVSFAALVIFTVLSPAVPLSRFLELKPLAAIGRVSYSLYIWQTLFLQTKMSFSHDFADSSAVIWRYLLDLACIGICALASYWFVEIPLQSVGRRLAKGLLPMPAISLDAAGARFTSRAGPA
jgi:peptidoglycan/LPS O-acetylase OafA/YrhL